ncbi:protein SLOW GREEN 1, chloroplastic-like [Phalaenopsis equestris]|uniref:protein SLOW GREEN 1, chloroplastic-like n=1 Tax=Phalaenopsis equestris TaxID=78828 RepID=UPI0009E43676|nr:protein SLOW GREEN 1, chloroplastic-like [Phalaenopsis equestris]
MESVSRTFRPPNFTLSFPSTINPPSLPLNPSSKTLISLRPSHKPLLSIRCSHKPPQAVHKTVTPIPLSTFLAAAATSAALLFVRFRFPSRAIAAIVSPVPAASAESLDSDQDLSDEEKERKLEEHLDSHPDDGRSLRALMELKVQAGKFQDAIAAVDRLIQLEPGENELLLLKAHIQSYSGDAEAARQGFEDLLVGDPLLVEAYHGLVMAQREVDGELNEILKRVETALETCKRLKRKEDVRDFKLLIAQIKVIEDKYEEALKIYQELVREEPRDFRPYLCQGIIYTLLRKKEEAEKHFEKYRRLVPREHPYSRYFDDNMIAMKVFSQIEENKRKESLKI